MIGVFLVYLSVFLSYASYIILYTLISKEKAHLTLPNILGILFLSFLSSMIGKLNYVFLNLCTSILIICAVLKLFFKISIKKSFYFCIVLSIISLICDAAVSLLMSNKYIINFLDFQNNRIFRSMLAIPVIMLSCLISNISIIKNIINKFYNKYISKLKFNKKYILILLLVLIILITTFSLNGYNRTDKIGFIFSTICIVVLINMVIITLYLIYREFQIDQCNKKIIEENKYIKEIAKQDAEFKHNLINNLLGIKTISNKKTNKLIDCLIEDYQVDYKKITNINDLPNGIQSIIYRKAYEENIDDLNLIVNNYIKEEIYDILTPKKYNHLCTSIGILFDNALEAVKNNFEKVIEINFEEDQEYIYFILKNSFSNILDLEETGKKNYTTKKNGHGIGLNYIKKLRTLEMKQEIINNTFIIKLRIKKVKKL